MSVTQTLSIGCGGIGTNDAAVVGKTASSGTAVDESIATGQTVFLINITIDVSAVGAFWMMSDQNITVKTNSSSAPDNTLALIANEPVMWWSTALHAFLLTADVTKIYVANASGATASLKIRVNQDATP